MIKYLDRIQVEVKPNHSINHHPELFFFSPSNSPTNRDLSDFKMLYSEQHQLQLRKQIQLTQSNIEQLRIQQMQQCNKPIPPNHLMFAVSPKMSPSSSSSSCSSSSSISMSPLSPQFSASYSISPPSYYLTSNTTNPNYSAMNLINSQVLIPNYNYMAKVPLRSQANVLPCMPSNNLVSEYFKYNVS